MKSTEKNVFKDLIPPPLSEKKYRNFKSFCSMNKVLEIKQREGLSDDYADISLYDCKISGHGPDDKIYGSNKKGSEKIRDLITRGCVCIEIVDKNTKEKEFHTFNGFCKFSGLNDMDDDDLAKLSKSGKETINTDLFFSESKNRADRLIAVEKENGKAAHFTCFKYKKRKYYVSGSKNVHVVYRNSKDLQGKNNQALHTKISRYFLDTLNRLDKKKRLEFEDMLCETNYFCNFEICLKDDQHIVDYEFSRKDYKVIFLSFTGRRIDNEEYIEECGKVVPMDKGLEYCQDIGLEIPKYSVLEYSKESLQKVIEETRGMTNSEGHVLYFIKGNKTLGLSKVKSYWYIFWRAIREKKKRKCKDFDQKIARRFEQIRGWLEISEESIKEWRIIANRFSSYLEKVAPRNDGPKKRGRKKDSVNISSSFATFIKNFTNSFEMPKDLDKAIEELNIKVAKKERKGKERSKKKDNQKERKINRNKKRDKFDYV